MVKDWSTSTSMPSSGEYHEIMCVCICICMYTYTHSIPLNVPKAEINTSSLSQGKLAVHFPVMCYVTCREFGQCVGNVMC